MPFKKNYGKKPYKKYPQKNYRKKRYFAKKKKYMKRNVTTIGRNYLMNNVCFVKLKFHFNTVTNGSTIDTFSFNS